MFSSWTSFLSTGEGEEGEIYIPHTEYAQFWCDKKVPRSRRLVSCFCNKSGMLYLTFMACCFSATQNRWCDIDIFIWYFKVNNPGLGFADSKDIATGYPWQQFASWGDIPGSAFQGITTNILLHKQIHYCFSRNCWRVWVSRSICGHNM